MLIVRINYDFGFSGEGFRSRRISKGIPGTIRLATKMDVEIINQADKGCGDPHGVQGPHAQGFGQYEPIGSELTTLLKNPKTK